MRQGPHQVAQKSTKTKPSSVSLANVASVTAFDILLPPILLLGIFPIGFPQMITLSKIDHFSKESIALIGKCSKR